jgi:hypothetical protein
MPQPPQKPLPQPAPRVVAAARRAPSVAGICKTYTGSNGPGSVKPSIDWTFA